MPEQRPKKLLRTSRACKEMSRCCCGNADCPGDYCHKRSIRCRPSAPDSATCQNCVDFDIPCTFTRPVRRGRARLESAQTPSHRLNGGGHNAANQSVDEGVTGNTPQIIRTDTNGSLTSIAINTVAPDQSWRALASVSKVAILKTLDIYFQVVYPIFPFFDREELFDKINHNVHLEDRNFFATVMAACALAAGRVEDGGVPSSKRQHQKSTIPSETYIAAAQESLPADLVNVDSFDALRAYPLLAIAGIQTGRIDSMHKYIGLYFAILSIRRWHDESQWPPHLSDVEKDQMRRVYWSTYTLDVYSSIVWNGCIHFQEAHSKVAYPAEYVQNSSLQHGQTSSWMTGWNFTTDLYRVLEHAVSRFRTQTSRFNILDVATPSSPTFSSGVNGRVNALYSNLPDIFKRVDPMTGDPTRDIFGFQAANIQATLALLRMTLFSVEAGQDISQKCSVASELLSIFHQIPSSYLRAISAPLVYHLFGIGNILGSVLNAPLSEASYGRVRELLISMATLLESLELGLHNSAGASKSLLDQVDRIDQFMAHQRQLNRPPEMHQSTSANVHPHNWVATPVNEISPQYQLPDDLLLDWNWPLHPAAESFLFFQ